MSMKAWLIFNKEKLDNFNILRKLNNDKTTGRDSQSVANEITHLLVINEKSNATTTV